MITHIRVFLLLGLGVDDVFIYTCLCLRSDEFKFGCTSLRVSPELLSQLRNDITVSPNGIAFVKVH